MRPSLCIPCVLLVVFCAGCASMTIGPFSAASAAYTARNVRLGAEPGGMTGFRQGVAVLADTCLYAGVAALVADQVDGAQQDGDTHNTVYNGDVYQIVGDGNSENTWDQSSAVSGGE